MLNDSTKNKIKHFGLRRYCPVCKSFVSRFLPYGKNERPDAMCPVCHSVERHRLLWKYLQKETELFNAPMRMLHIAPENCFVRRLKRIPTMEHVGIDLDSSLADHFMDITKLDFREKSFDFLLCSHVLEHVVDDLRAMSEFCRVLKDDAVALIAVPLSGKEETVEAADSMSTRERMHLFGQADHVRSYGSDIEDRLSSCGFTVEKIKYGRSFSQLYFSFMRLSQEFFYVCRKKSL